MNEAMQTDRGMKILVVDDEAAMRTLGMRFLKLLGHEVVTAENGRIALDKLAEEHFPVVFSDIQMPVMDGMEFLRHAKKLYPETDVIMMTGYGNDAGYVDVIQEGASDFIVKPIEFMELAAKLRRVLRERRLLNDLRRDTEERIQAERALREKDAQLIHADRLSALGEMATAMAHEINQPLSVISMSLQGWEVMLQRGRLGLDRVGDDIPKLKRMVERIAAIIDHVRDFGRQRHAVTAVDIEKTVGDACNLCRMQFKNHGIQFLEEYGRGGIIVLAVGTEIEQVVLNLLANARYSVERWQEKDATHLPKVLLAVTRTDVAARIAIEDNGGGVAPEIADRIFEPFFTTKPAHEGTGLGLSISRQIVEKFAGTLELDNHPGKGAVFVITLPLAAEAAAPEEAGAS